MGVKYFKFFIMWMYVKQLYSEHANKNLGLVDNISNLQRETCMCDFSKLEEFYFFLFTGSH